MTARASLAAALAAATVFAPRVSPDGTRIAFENVDFISGSASVTVANLRALDDRYELPLYDGSMNWAPSWSPDGRFMAYATNESGRYEVFVERLPQDGVRVPITAEALPIEGFVQGEYRRQFELMPDGQRLLMLFPLERPQAP